MPSEREIKLGMATAKGVCSISGRPCKCDSSRGCRAQRTSVDRLPTPLLYRLQTLGLHLSVCREDCEWIQNFDERERIYPQPEIRDIRRQLEELERFVEELCKR